MSSPYDSALEEYSDESSIDGDAISSLTDRSRSASPLPVIYTPASPALTRLPPELLLEIFLEYKRAQQDHFERTRVNLWACDYSWIKVAQVCYHWRTVALQAPSLWTSIYIPTARPPWVDELIRRSKSTPLSMLSVRLSSLDIDRAVTDIRYLTAFLGHDRPIPSVRRLQICLGFKYESKKEVSSADLSPSVLVDLRELTFWSYADAKHNEVFIRFFASYSSRLRCLSLWGCVWDRRLLHDTLTYLKLHGTAQSYGTIRWDEFCSALASLKRLQSLKLSGVLLHLQPSLGGGYREFTLTYPRLQSLTLLGDGTEHYIHFLQKASYPTQASLNLRAGRYGVEDGLTTLLNILSRSLYHNSSPHPHQYQKLSLSVSLEARSHLNVLLRSNPDLPAATVPFDCGILLQPTIGSSLQNGILKILESINPRALRHLNLYTSKFTFSERMAQIIATFPVLHTLELHESDASSILPAFRSIPILSCNCAPELISSNSEPAQMNEMLLCQSCTSSQLENTCFPSLGVLYCNGSRKRELSDEDVLLLRRILLTRNLVHHGMEEVHLRGWGSRSKYPSGSIDGLELLCNSFTWLDS